MRILEASCPWGCRLAQCVAPRQIEAGSALLVGGTVLQWHYQSDDVEMYGDAEWEQAPFGTPLDLGGLVVDDLQGLCGVSDTGELSCWRAGSIAAIDLGAPVIKKVTTNFECAWLETGEVKCWGETSAGGFPPEPGPELEAIDLGDGVVRDLQAEGGMACVLLEGGAIACWTDEASPSSIELSAPAVAFDLCMSGDEGLAVLEGGGDVEFFRLGSGALMVWPIAGNAISVSCGYETGCVTVEGGRLHCQGRFPWNGSDGEWNTPDFRLTKLPADLHFVSVTADYEQVCATEASGEAYCWGNRYFPIAGDGQVASLQPSFGPVPGGRCGADEEGATACGIPAEGWRVQCRSGRWIAIDPCATGTACEPVSGACVEVPAVCAEGTPGVLACAGNDVVRCLQPPELETLETCAVDEICVEGACRPAACDRDGIVEAGEACDDGNDDPFDGCHYCDRIAAFVVEGRNNIEPFNWGGQSRNVRATTCALTELGRVRCRNGSVTFASPEGSSERHGDEPVESWRRKSAWVDFGRRTDGGRIRVTELAFGGAHGCARLETGKVRCWGDNDQGQVGLDPEQVRRVEGLGPELEIPAGAFRLADDHSCVLSAAGAATCWDPELAPAYADEVLLDLEPDMYRVRSDGSVWHADEQRQLPEGRSAVALAHAANQWFSNSFALLDDGSIARLNPTITEGIDLEGHTATSLAGGVAQGCALLDDGSYSCWPMGFDQALGAPLEPVRTELPDGHQVAQLGLAKGRQICYLRDDRRAFCLDEDDEPLEHPLLW